MKFKTNAKCQGCTSKIAAGVKKAFPDAELNFDLQHTDRLMEVHGVPENAENARKVETAIAETGFKGSWLPPMTQQYLDDNF